MSYGHRQEQQRKQKRRPSGLSLRLIIALGIVLFSVITYYAKTDENPITGEQQRVGLTEEQEIKLGLRARSDMAAQHGGAHHDPEARRYVDRIGSKLVNVLNQQLAAKGKSIGYPFEFHLLADRRTINAFALPGGQVFITFALYNKMETEGQLAGVLGHEIGHVIHRHGAERMASQKMWSGIAGAAGVAGGDINSARMAQMVANFTMMQYGRQDELESDRWGVQLMTQAGYDPNAMLGVMDILEKYAGGGGQPEMLSTHPLPKNRKAYIERIIKEQFPNGLPPGLKE
ncbi:MAG: M48 family metalloprotease [Pirellulaceae bacterium]